MQLAWHSVYLSRARWPHGGIGKPKIQCKAQQVEPVTTLEKMLDEWYKQTLHELSLDEAQKLLISILKKTCVPMVASSVGNKMKSIPRGDSSATASSVSDNKDSRGGSYNNQTGDNNRSYNINVGDGSHVNIN